MTINYGVYFDKAGTTTRLPINPTEINIQYPGDSNKYDVLGIGEIIQPKKPKLRIFEWESILPGLQNVDEYVVTVNERKAPQEYIDLINGFKADSEPVQLVINRIMEDETIYSGENLFVIVNEFTTTEKAGETGDFYYKIKCTEYKEFEPLKVDIQISTVNVVNSGTIGSVITDEGVTTPVINESQSTVSTQTNAQIQTAITVPQRKVSKTVLCVGDTVTVNGIYWTTQDATPPSGRANNEQGVIQRIVDNTKSKVYSYYPYCVYLYGKKLKVWVMETQLKKE